MEYAPGGSVAELMLRRDRPLSVGETVARRSADGDGAGRGARTRHRPSRRQAAEPADRRVRAGEAVRLRYRRDGALGGVPGPDERDLDAIREPGGPRRRRRRRPAVRRLLVGRHHAAPRARCAADAQGAVDAMGTAGDRRRGDWRRSTPSSRRACGRRRASVPSAAEVADELERLGWSIDERNRSLAFEAVDLDDDLADVARPIPGRPRPHAHPSAASRP